MKSKLKNEIQKRINEMYGQRDAIKTITKEITQRKRNIRMRDIEEKGPGYIQNDFIEQNLNVASDWPQ